jgi:hypothetical protein
LKSDFSKAFAAAALVIFIVVMAGRVFWPGISTYDTVFQYRQLTTNNIDDWHAPVMARVWQLLVPIGDGTGPLFALQMLLYGVGFALLIGSLVRAGRPWTAFAVGSIAISPLLLGWQIIVMKDEQMLGALIAAFGIVAAYRLSGRQVPAFAVLIAALLLTYATLLRGNAVFATVPFALLLLPRPESWAFRSLVAIVGMAALLVFLPPVGRVLFDARPSPRMKTQPLFDLAGMAARTPSEPWPFTPTERGQIVSRNCHHPFFWDPLGGRGPCADATARVRAWSTREISIALARKAAHHPLAYAEHRVAHWNMTQRLWVPSGLISAEPPSKTHPNDLGLLGPPIGVTKPWQRLAGMQAATPLGWPIVWTVMAFVLLPVAFRRRDNVGSLALALLGSAAILELSFLVVSIASELRYHLWPMTATAVAVLLLADRLRPAIKLGLAITFLIVTIIGAIAREVLPRAPGTYRAMIENPLRDSERDQR